jgi:hypothetical protein
VSSTAASCSLSGEASATVSGGVYVYENSAFERFDPEPETSEKLVDIPTCMEGKWTTLAPINTPVHGQLVAAVGSTLHTIGGAGALTHGGPVATVGALGFIWFRPRAAGRW